MIRIKFLATIFCIVISLNIQAQIIFKTACEGNLTKLDSLLNDSTDINIVNRRGQSLLHYAVQCNQGQVIEFLLDQGIDINIKDNKSFK
jgi:ankyrin repeat protein